MVIGICRIDLSLPGNASLKGKRSVVRRICDRTTGRFNAAVAEVEDQDVLQAATIGVAVVSNSPRHVNSMIDRIVSFIEGIGEALVVDRDMEIVHYGDGPGSPADAEWDDFAEDDGVG